MTSQNASRAVDGHLVRLTAILFLCYVCVAMPLAVVPVFVTTQLGLGNVWAGLGVGLSFLATILSRGYAGSLSDRRGSKIAMRLGLVFFIGGALVVLLAGLVTGMPLIAYALLLAGRLGVGIGESLITISVLTWGVGLAGPARASRVLAIVGAAMYGGLALGGPLGVLIFDHGGFAAAMALTVLLPACGLAMTWLIPAVAALPQTLRPSFFSVVGRIWWHGLIVCLQGIGFAAIGAFFVLYLRAQDWPYAGLGLTAFGVGFVLVRLLFGATPDRFGGLTVAIVSLSVETVGQILIWAAPHPAAAFAGAFLTGAGCSMVFPAMGREVIRIIEPQLRGTAIGAFAAFQDIAYGLTGPVAGLVADRAGYGSVYLIGGITTASALAIALTLRRAENAAAADEPR